MLQRCFALNLQECFVDYIMDIEYILILRWPYPLSFSNYKSVPYS